MGSTTIIQLLDRYYRLFTPTGVGSPAPLIVFNHPGLSNAENIQTALGLDAASEAHSTPFYVAYGYGGGFFTQSGDLLETWYTGHTKSNGKHVSGRSAGISYFVKLDDVDFLRRMIAHIKNSVSISDVYMAGYSNGGQLTYSFASLYPTEIEAATVLAGSLMIDTDDMESSIPIPIRHAHGLLDPILPVAGGTPTNSATALLFSGVLRPLATTLQLFQDRGATVTYYPLPTSNHNLSSISDGLVTLTGQTAAEFVAAMVP